MLPRKQYQNKSGSFSQKNRRKKLSKSISGYYKTKKKEKKSGPTLNLSGPTTKKTLFMCVFL